jgi:hypothetical protein
MAQLNCTSFSSRSLPLAARVVVAGTLLASITACQSLPHTQLTTAPNLDDRYEKRAAYFKKYSPDTYDGSRVLLHDGTAIYYPEDLAPAVDPESPTASAIAKNTKLRAAIEAKTPLVMYPAYGLVALGAVGMFSSLAFTGSNQDGLFLGTMLGGTGLMVAGVAWGYIGSAVMLGDDERALNDATSAVLTTYAQSLSDRVGIQPDADGHLADTAGNKDTGSAPVPPSKQKPKGQKL